MTINKYAVYQKFIGGERLYGKTNHLITFSNEQDAVKHIANCYKKDMQLGQSGEYYYFIK